MLGLFICIWRPGGWCKYKKITLASPGRLSSASFQTPSCSSCLHHSRFSWGEGEATSAVPSTNQSSWSAVAKNWALWKQLPRTDSWRDRSLPKQMFHSQHAPGSQSLSCYGLEVRRFVSLLSMRIFSVHSLCSAPPCGCTFSHEVHRKYKNDSDQNTNWPVTSVIDFLLGRINIYTLAGVGNAF